MNMTTEIRFIYYRARRENDKEPMSIMLQMWEDGKPLDIVIHPKHVYADHPHELFHNYDSHNGRFIGVGLKYKIMDDEDE